MPYTLHGSILSETAKALKFEIEKINEDSLDEPQVEWFPFYQIKKIMKNKIKEMDNIKLSDLIIDSK